MKDRKRAVQEEAWAEGTGRVAHRALATPQSGIK